MVTLPSNFVATKYPGYFWNLKEQKLYTMKISGVLRVLKKSLPNQWNFFKESYRISHQGHRRTLEVSYLKTLVDKNSIIPLEHK